MAKIGHIPTERFLDVNYEPQRRLTPIQGYELKPLVSLEDAVRPLESLILNIQGFVWTATGNCENPKDGLKPDESAAIYLYTMECMYRQLNAALRSENRQQLTAYFSYLKLFLTALWKLDNINSVVWRGVKENIADQYPEGKKFVWWGLSSCTTALSVLQGNTFLGEIGPRTLFNIQCFNGKMIQNHSQFPNESEVLLLPCSYFEVMGVIKQGPDFHIIHLKQIEPPVTLIQPPSPTFALSHPSESSNPVPSMNNNFAKMNVSLTTASSKNIDAPAKMLRLDILKKKPKLSIKIRADSISMATNEKYLLFCSRSDCGNLALIDEQGNVKQSIERNFGVTDICWSSYSNQFLILNEAYDGYGLYSLDMDTSKTQELTKIEEFHEEMCSCTCYDNTFIVCSKSQGEGSKIGTFNLSNWKLRREFKPPISCREDQGIIRIRFNSNGIHLGVLLGEKNRFLFQLRSPNDMNVLQITEIEKDKNCWILALTNEQFLISICKERKFYLIDSTGKLNEKFNYDDVAKHLLSTALINKKCLVIHTDEPNQLHFYDL